MYTRAPSLVLLFTAVIGASSMAFSQEPAWTTIIVELPAAAQLWVNGRRTTSTGAEREFRDSRAQLGGVYRYDLLVSVERDGRTMSQQRSLRILAGESVRAAFQFPQVTTALKQLSQVTDDLLVQASALQPSRFQPRPAQGSDLPELPAVGGQADDGFQPRTPDLSDPADTGAFPPAQLELPDLGDPANDGRFGSQFGDQPEDEPMPAGDDLFVPEQPVDPMQVEQPANQPGDAVGAQAATSATPHAAYIGHGHQHHLTGDTGTALYVWQHAWHMVRLQKASTSAGVYTVYNDVDHPGFDWAYGRFPFSCNQFPVFFKPGGDARWNFVGYAKQVRPIVD